ncbi:HAMP domain-containing sensor histidine kinase [Synechococcus sp. KORDI-52]|uniref:sensor histidine kinase n=1 Tax=Synechococcus sp. KORDI-52 TaxID=585425 RepID=UPI000A759F13|nr:HAMP domain-containing sensor histidine kinase [Synechococcus sp. KORDI-52]
MALRLPSLKIWIQSTCLLVFFGGYAILFAVSKTALEAESLQHHQHLVSSVRRGLIRQSLTLPIVSPLGFRAELLRDAETSAPSMYTGPKGAVWITSVSPLPSDGSNSFLRVTENASDFNKSHQAVLNMMIFTASASVLVAALLLRLVIWRGLVIPLNDLSREMDCVEADSLGSRLIDLKLHPSEFQHIVHAFNDLQSRLSSSWQRERQFVDGVAHELRTPITVLTSSAERLLEEAPCSTQSSIDLILAESHRLADLLNVMLDFARVDAGRLALSIELIDPELFQIHAFERLQGLSPHRIRLAAPTQTVVPMIHADEQRLHQCLAALVENALRYSSGFVDMALSIHHEYVVFHVIDQGKGIPEKERDNVLQRFVRGTTSIGTRGSGMGLAIVNDLMMLMNGMLVIDNVQAGGGDVQLKFRTSMPLESP